MSDRPAPDVAMIQFVVDGQQVEVVDNGFSLLAALRAQLGVRSPKAGCNPQGQCGCCTVLVDGSPRVACVTPARRVAGRSITTVDGLPEADRQLWADAFLAVGASLDLGHFRAQPAAITAATLLKLLLMPCLMATGAVAFGITGTAKTALLICAAVPGASSSYILARQLGGDAPLMANITTVQTLAAMLTMPLMLWVLGS
jgi:ferredoxin